MPVDVDLAGVKVLGLLVTDGGDGASYDHADWAEANIVVADGAPRPVVLPPYETIRLQTKDFSLDFEVGDDGRLYQKALARRKRKRRSAMTRRIRRREMVTSGSPRCRRPIPMATRRRRWYMKV